MFWVVGQTNLQLYFGRPFHSTKSPTFGWHDIRCSALFQPPTHLPLAPPPPHDLLSINTVIYSCRRRRRRVAIINQTFAELWKEWIMFAPFSIDCRSVGRLPTPVPLLSYSHRESSASQQPMLGYRKYSVKGIKWSHLRPRTGPSAGNECDKWTASCYCWPTAIYF